MSKDMSLKIRLTSLFLAVSILPLILIIALTYNRSSDNVQHEVEKTLKDSFSNLFIKGYIAPASY